MNKLFPFLRIFLLVAVTLMVSAFFSHPALADTTATATATAAATASLGTFGAFMAWFASHQMVLGAFLTALLDLVIGINPKWKSSGIIHFIGLCVQAINSNAGTATTQTAAATTSQPAGTSTQQAT